MSGFAEKFRSAHNRNRGNRALECSVRTDLKDKRSANNKSVTFKSEKSSKKQTETDWNRFTRREERDGEDEESDESYMMTASCCCNRNKVKINIAEDEEYMYSDSCAPKRFLILRDQSLLESFGYSVMVKEY